MKHWMTEREYLWYQNLASTKKHGVIYLRRADDDDWRLKLLRDAGMNMDRYKEAQEKRRQDYAQGYGEEARKAENEDGHTDNTDDDDDLL